MIQSVIGTAVYKLKVRAEFLLETAYLSDTIVFRVRGSHDKQLVVLIDRNRVSEGVLSVRV